MSDEEIGKTAGEPDSGQASAPEAGTQESQGQEGGQEASRPSWTVGDQTFDDPAKMAEAFKEFHGSFTRRSQELAELRKEAEPLKHIWNFIKGDPELVAEVKRKWDSGKTAEQSVRETAQQSGMDLSGLQEDLKSLKEWRAQQEEQAEEASALDAESSFKEKHPDLSEEEKGAIREFLSENVEWLRSSGVPHERMLELAYNDRVLPKKSGAFITKGQEMKEAEIEKGRKAASLGTKAASSGAKVEKRPRGVLSPAQERKWAWKIAEQTGLTKVLRED